MLKAVALAAMAALMASCGRLGDPCADAAVPPLQFLVSPATLQLAPGERAPVVAQLPTVVGRCTKLSSRTIGWSVSDPSVARVEPDTGSRTTVVGLSAGSAAVVATLVANPAVRAAAAVHVASGN